MKDTPYFQQASLMIQAMPAVAAETCFALKGGTAINLFVRDMPRLSVDLDLVYLPLEPREQALGKVGEALERIASRIRRQISGCRVSMSRLSGNGVVDRLLVEQPGATVKLEPNTVIRGTLFKPTERDLVPAAEELFEQATTMRIASLPDLYGGKICAALDRQHPRDFFDVLLLLENEGLTDEVMDAFIVYLASHNRPMNELLNPRFSDVSEVFDREFAGMTRTTVSKSRLQAVGSELIRGIHERLTDKQKRFLIGLKQGNPDWSLLPFKGLAKYPALQWKLRNIRAMSKKKRTEQLERLMRVLNVEVPAV